MLGVIITITGAIAAYRLWEDHTTLSIIAIIAALYQASSLNEMFKEKEGLQPEDRWQTTINLISTVVIIGLLIASFII